MVYGWTRGEGRMKRAIIIIAAVLLAGCAATYNAQPRREAYVETHGHYLSYTIKQSILAGRPCIGMRPGMLEASMGRPNEINRTRIGSDVSEQWFYRRYGGKAIYVYFDNGVVTAIQD